MMIGSVIRAAVVLYSLHTCASELALDEPDDWVLEETVSLLQAEMVLQAREKHPSKKATGVVVDMPQPEDAMKPDSFCEDKVTSDTATATADPTGQPWFFDCAAFISGGIRSHFVSLYRSGAPWSIVEAEAKLATLSGAASAVEGAKATLLDSLLGSSLRPLVVNITKLIVMLLALECLRHIWEREFGMSGVSADSKRKAKEPVLGTSGANAAPKLEAKDAWRGLLEAVLAGDVDSSKTILSGSQIDICRVDTWGCSLLHAAAKGGATPVVEMLLARGAGVHDRDAWDETPLHIAARAGHAEVCDSLVVHGSDVDAVNAQEWTPLIVAADSGHEALCQLLLRRGATCGGLEHASLPSLLQRLLANEPEGVDCEDERVSLTGLMLVDSSSESSLSCEDFE